MMFSESWFNVGREHTVVVSCLSDERQPLGIFIGVLHGKRFVLYEDLYVNVNVNVNGCGYHYTFISYAIER